MCISGVSSTTILLAAALGLQRNTQSAAEHDVVSARSARSRTGNFFPRSLRRAQTLPVLKAASGPSATYNADGQILPPISLTNVTAGDVRAGAPPLRKTRTPHTAPCDCVGLP